MSPNARFADCPPHDCLLNRLFGRRSKKTSKLRVTGLCVVNSPGTGEFPAQMASIAENVSIWWRHHAVIEHCKVLACSILKQCLLYSVLVTHIHVIKLSQHIHVIKLSHHLPKRYLVGYLLPSHYLNQYWITGNSAFRKLNACQNVIVSRHLCEIMTHKDRCWILLFIVIS